jgi:hypothetical protein
MLSRWRSLFRALTARREFEDNMAEELLFHIEQYTGLGLRSTECRRRAAAFLRQFQLQYLGPPATATVWR